MAPLFRLSTIVAAAALLVANDLAKATVPRDLVAELLAPVSDLGNAPPPNLLWTPNPSAECAGVNAGELQCCRGALAGDLPIIVFLARVYGFELNPNDVNGILCEWTTTFSLAKPTRLVRIADREMYRLETVCAETLGSLV